MKTTKGFKLTSLKMSYPAIIWAMLLILAYDYYFIAQGQANLSKLSGNSTNTFIGLFSRNGFSDNNPDSKDLP